MQFNTSIKRLEAVDKRLHRRLNAENFTKKFLEMAVTDKVLIKRIIDRKIKYFGHINRGQNYKILKLIIKGKSRDKKFRQTENKLGTKTSKY